jgi:hypothetical protein
LTLANTMSPSLYTGTYCRRFDLLGSVLAVVEMAVYFADSLGEPRTNLKL